MVQSEEAHTPDCVKYTVITLDQQKITISK